MSNLMKKVTSAVAAFAVVFTAVSPVAGVNAAFSSSLEAANKLASVGVIVDQSANPADYRLGDNITRREMMKIAMQLASSQGVTINTAYQGKFTDVPESDWAWKYAETALDNGFVAANAMFYPSRNVTKAEALKMIMNASGVEKAANDTASWEDDYVEGGVAAGIVESFSDYSAQADRGWIFKAAASSLEASTETSSDDDLLDELLGGLDDSEDTTTEDTTTGTTGNGTFTVVLSPETPVSASVPGSVNGLPVASFDFTAGEEDVTVTSVTVKRRGLSDSDTLENVAAFSAEGRASKGKNDSEENNTEATLTLTNGFVVKAGETRTLTVVVDINTASQAANDEFAIELVEVVASVTADSEGSLVGNTFRVGSVDAAELTISDNGSVSDPKLGDEGADIFKFELQGANDEDIVLKSITFKATDADAEDDLANFVLVKGTTELATTAMMNGKYLTFNLGDGLTIGEDKTERFTVKADVVAGAADTFGFFVDKELDITAEGTKYGYGAAITLGGTSATNLGDAITVEAGELTLVDIDAASDKMREDKDNVVLGKVSVTNVSGGNLELQEFGVKAVLDAGTASGADNAALALPTLFENFELVNEETGAAYELTLTGTTAIVYQDTDLNITLPQGTVTFLLRADTAADISNFDTASVTFSLTTGSVGGNGGFKVVELEDDEVVTDLTPASLSWKTIDGSESAATVSLVPLADVTKVRGSTDVVALQFEVEADESSALTMDEVKVLVQSGATNVSSLQVSQVALYKGSVSTANLLDRVSGSQLAAGVATFDGFNVAIAANAEQAFVVTVSFVDGAEAVASYKTTLNSISVEDEDNDDVNATGALGSPTGTSARDIAVVNVGEISTLAVNASRSENENDKVILAGNSMKVVAYDVKSNNESVDVETVTFTYSGADLQAAGATASLYLGDTLVKTNSNSELTATTITFNDLTSLIVPTTTTQLKLAINTAATGKDLTGTGATGFFIDGVTLSDAEGVDSGKVVTGTALTSTNDSKLFDVVSATVVASSNDQFGTNDATAKVTLVANVGNNVDAQGNELNVEVTTLTFEVSSLTVTGSLTVRNGNGDNIGSAVVSAIGNVTVDVTDDIIGNNNETYEIESTAEAVIRLTKTGVGYDTDTQTGLTNKSTTTLNLGTYAKTN